MAFGFFRWLRAIVLSLVDRSSRSRERRRARVVRKTKKEVKGNARISKKRMISAAFDALRSRMPLRYASVCDGIGAAHVAWHPLGWRCSWTSEIEPFPAAVVDRHFGFPNVGDMTKITEEMLNGYGPIDLLVGGTPCQSFSVAGLRKGLDDPRGNLALRFVQLAGCLRPQWIVWENVPGVLSSGKGRDFGAFLGALAELGYGFAYRVLDAQWFGVAQRRRRVFVVANARDWRRAAAVLFERESVCGNPPTRGEAWQGVARSTASSLTSSGRGVERCGESRGQDDVVLHARGRDTSGSTGDGLARCITTGEMKRQDWETCNFVAFHPTQDPISSTDGSTHAMGCGSKGGCATQAVATPTHIRRLTVTECERLQGFPDDYTAITYRNKPAADGPRYRALGNSMAVPVMRWIGERIAMVNEIA